MKRAIWLTLGVLMASAASWAQSVVGVTVGLSLPGPVYYVDGQAFNTQQVFLWPVGSKHTLQFLVSVNAQGTDLPYQSANGDVARWTFSGWSENTGLLAPQGATAQTITATTALTSIIGNVTLAIPIQIKFANDPAVDGCNTPAAPGNPPASPTVYGIVYMDGVCFATTTTTYVPAGVHNFNAFPYPGYVFTGWLVPGYPPDSYLFSYTINSAQTITADFQPAKRVKFVTNPPGLSVYVDHTLIATPPSFPTSILPSGSYDPVNCTPDYTRLPPNAPLGYKPLCTGEFDFLPGSTHQLAAPVSQQDAAAKYWVFQSFSNGLGQNSNYVVDNKLNVADVVTANFVPGVLSTIITNPSGLALSVDGRTNWPSYNFIWGEGQTHTVSAPAIDTDSNGRQWQFMGWTDKGDATHSITVPVGSQGLAVSASYQQLGQVQVTSNPPGLNLTVDGKTCTTPCTYNKASGSTLAVSVPASIPVTSVSRYDLDGVTGATGNTATVTFNQGVQVVTATYHTSYLLATGSTPSASATFQLTPSSPDSFFPAGTAVTVTAVAKGGFKFSRWNGDLTGTFSTGYLAMTSPHQVTAVLTVVPYIAPTGVQNAAGETPDGSVAPGSIVSIYGSNLAAGLQIGPSNPLAQTIGGVTVTLNDRILPLMFVSPQQINAQIFSDLPDGDYTLVVHLAGQPDVPGQFTIHRDAPALFSQLNPDGTAQVVALHADGSAVNVASPAQSGETVTFFGTGFGPYDQPVVDGFAIPAVGVWNVVDPVSVQVGGQSVQPNSATGVPGVVGITVVQVTLPTVMPAGAPLNLAVTVNGRASSTAPLPVQ
jgi:uncharacterized protein (TIGR03437 family)